MFPGTFSGQTVMRKTVILRPCGLCLISLTSFVFITTLTWLLELKLTEETLITLNRNRSKTWILFLSPSLSYPCRAYSSTRWLPSDSRSRLLTRRSVSMARPGQASSHHFIDCKQVPGLVSQSPGDRSILKNSEMSRKLFNPSSDQLRCLYSFSLCLYCLSLWWSLSSHTI